MPTTVVPEAEKMTLAEIVKEWSGSEELYEADEIQDMETTLRSLPAGSGDEANIAALRKATLKKIHLWATSRTVTHTRKDMLALMRVLERVSDRGHNSLIRDETMRVTCVLHNAFAPYTRNAQQADDCWVHFSTTALNLLANCTSQQASSQDSLEGAAMKLSVVWGVFDLAWDCPVKLPPTAMADGMHVVLSLRSQVSGFEGACQQRYFQVLVLGMTMVGVHVADMRPEEEAKETRSCELFPPGSAALQARATLLSHLQYDTYQALFFLRLFLQAHSPQGCGELESLIRRPRCLHTEPLPQKEVQMVRGALLGLRCFMFPEDREKATLPLSAKETLVVLNSVRYALATRDASVVKEVLCLVKRLLEDDVAEHLESQWCVVLNIMTDIASHFSYEVQEREGMQALFFAAIAKMASLTGRMELQADRDRALNLADNCLDYFGEDVPQAELRTLAASILTSKMSTIAGTGSLSELMRRHLLCSKGRWSDLQLKKDCLTLFKAKQLHCQTGMLEAGLLSLIKTGDDDTFALSTGWTPEVANDVVALLVEVLLGANHEGFYLPLPMWGELVRMCREIAMNNAKGTALSTEKRLEVASAIVKAATHKIGLTTASYCSELWKALMLMLFHPDTKVRCSVLAYFLSLRCNEDFEVTSSLASQGNIQAVAAVAREPLCSLEAEFPVAQVLHTVQSRILIDSECFSDNMKTVRHFLTNNYFMVGNAAANAGCVQRLASAFVSLVGEESWQVLSQLSVGVSAVQEIASTVTALIPYVNLVPMSGREETYRSILYCLTALLRKSLEAWSLFSATSDGTIASLTDIFGALHVALYHFLTPEELVWPSLREAAGVMLQVLGSVALKALEVAQTVKESAKQEQSKSSSTLSNTMDLKQDSVTVHAASTAPSAPPSGAASPVPQADGSTSGLEEPLRNSSFAGVSMSQSYSELPSDVPPVPFLSATNVHGKQCLVSLLSLIHSIVSSCLTDDNQPACRAPEHALHEFSDAVFALLADVTDTAQYEHRIHFLAHMVVAEMLHQNRRNMPHPASRHEFLKRLIFSVKPKQRFSKKADAEDGEGSKELQRATADLAWRSFYLGSTEMYPRWDPLTEAFFSDGETQCWMTNGPHAPCVISTTTGRSQHMLVTIRSLTASVCWTCILHNKPSMPHIERPYITPSRDPGESSPEEPIEAAPMRAGVSMADLLTEHDEDMRGLIGNNGSFCSMRVAVDEKEEAELKEEELDGLRAEGSGELEVEASSTSTTSPRMREVLEMRRHRVSASSIADDDALLLRDSPVPSYDSPHKGAATKFSSIAASASVSSQRGESKGSLPRTSQTDVLNNTWEELPYLAPMPSKGGQASSVDGMQPSPMPTPRQRMHTPAPSTEMPPFCDVLANSIHSAFILSMFKMTPPPQRLRWDDQLLRTLSALDRIPCKETHKYV